MIDNWWQTELGGPTIATLPAMPSKPGAAGKPLAGVVADVVDREGNPMPDGKGGLLVLRTTVPAHVPHRLRRPRTLRARLVDRPGRLHQRRCRDPRRRRLLSPSSAAPTTSSTCPATGSARPRSRARSSPTRRRRSRRHRQAGRGSRAGDQGVRDVASRPRPKRADTRSALVAHVRHDIGPIATPSEIEFRDRAAEDPLRQDHAPPPQGRRTRRRPRRPDDARRVTTPHVRRSGRRPQARPAQCPCGHGRAAAIAPTEEIGYPVGLMFWFERNRLVGSYSFLTATSLS